METRKTETRRLSPYCAKLWSKKRHFSTAPPQEERDILDGSNHCWCNETKMVLGPDREIVSPEDCREGRSCFVPYGAG